MADQQSNDTHTIEREALERILSDANAEPIQISYQFVKSITKNFSEVVGRGGFGEVYLGFHRNEKKVAVKKIFGSQVFSDKPFLDEINCLMMVKHKNIARFLAYCAETKEQLIKYEGRFILADVRQRFLCFEYVPNGNLDAYLKDNCRGDDWQTRYQMIIGVCQGLNYLHQKRINHLDLKPENILLDALLEPKITDFGVSRFFSEGQSRIITKSIVGTFGYIAPEILQHGEISFKADVYSLGLIIIKLLTGHDKYDYENWHKSLDMENPQLKSCMEIASNCRHDDQHKRPSISEIICQLKDMESIAENGSWVNQELRNGRQLSSIYQGLHVLTVNSSSERFSSLPAPSSARGPLDVVIVYAFDCSTWTSSWYAVDDGVFWMVQEKLAKFTDSCMGYIYVMLTGNTYTCDMKIVDPAETRATGYTGFARRRVTCYKNMACGLSEAHKMINNRGSYENGIILLFSDGLENKGDFFDGAENFVSKVPVHTFTFDGDAYNHVLYSIAENSPGGKFHTRPVPERPLLSTAFSKLLDNILGGTPEDDEKPPSPISGRGPLDVVMVYAFDCTKSTAAWHTVDNGVFWLLQEKLTHFPDSCMGYIYVMSAPNTYTSDMKLVDSAETKATGYTGFARRRMDCTKNMASGLPEAHKMIRSRGDRNGIILFFSDGLANKGDFFDGTDNFISKVPVHTFTLGGDAYNHGLQAIAAKSPGGTFNPVPVPERPQLSAPFSKLLDRLLGGTMKD